MKQKKSLKIIILIIILLILILIAGIAFAYFSTDLFKSNKQLFFKYIGQIGNSENGLIEENINQYFTKKENTPYKNQGELYVEISAPDEYKEQVENTNNMNITFDGEVDKANSNREENISINYSDKVNIDFIYKKIQDTCGIQSKYLDKKFITVQSEDLGKVLNSESTISIDNTLDTVENYKNISQEEMKKILEKYTQVLNQELQENSFSKIEENNQTGYKLTLKGEQLKNILTKLLETLQNDEELLNKINEKDTVLDSNTIAEMIEEIGNNEELNEKTIEITIFKNSKGIERVSILVDQTKIEISKNEEESNLQYSINIEIVEPENNETTKIGLNAKYSGIQETQNVQESYEIIFEFPIGEETASYKYYFNNNIEFEETSNIEQFDEENTMNLSTMDEAKSQKLMDAISKRIERVNKDKMKDLGVNEDENPLINMLPTLYLYNSFMSAFQEQANEMNEMEIQSFNTKFELYEGTNIRGTTVKGLLTVIASNNGLDEDENENENGSQQNTYTSSRKIEEINFDGEEYDVNLQNLTSIREEVSTEDYYKVEFEKDSDTGAIYRAVIMKK